MSPPPPDRPEEALDPASLRRLFLLSSIVFYGGGFLVTWLVTTWSSRPDLRLATGPWGELSTWTGVGQQAAIGTAAGLAVVLVGLLGRQVLPALREMEREFAGFFSWKPGWGDLLLLAVTSSVAEEAFFRGLLQPWLGLHITSLVFAICHPPLSRRLVLWTPFALAMGYLLGWLFESSGGSLVAPILAHFAVNLLNLRLITRTTGGEDGMPFAEPTPLSPSEPPPSSGHQEQGKELENRDLQ